jgi:glycosyltransferase involved in cell wall biosynthesis
MRIAMVAPPWFRVPPEGYGAVERIVCLLAKGLRSRGHEVTVYCREASAELPAVPCLPEVGADAGQAFDPLYEMTYYQRVYARVGDGRFDLVHDHSNLGVFAADRSGLGLPIVHSLYLDMVPAQLAFLRELDDRVALVACSRSQAARATGVRVHAAVHLSYDDAETVAPRGPGDYLVQLAKIHPNKGQHVAVEVARRAGLPLVLAGPVDLRPVARAYFQETVEPHLGDGLTWVPSVWGRDKGELLAGARAMLFPIQWEEPFGMAVVEAMACGTPVVSTPRGAAPELIEPGVTGWLGAGTEELVAGVRRAGEIDPERCARRARERFGEPRMSLAYEQVYRQVLAGERRRWR